MASFREQMQRLADNIARSRTERKAFLESNQKECSRMRRELSDQRKQMKMELAQEAKTLGKQLATFKRDNQKEVQRTLRDLRNTRLRDSRNSKAQLKQEILRNRREIARFLRQNNSDRKRSARHQDRASAATIQSIRSQVQRIRSETKRMTKTLSRDRSDARQIWLRLRNKTTSRRDITPSPQISEPSLNGSVETVSSLESVAVSVRIPDLPLPPVMVPQGVS
ncbi:hypothetical protein SH449x_004580 [Pirellulaceae bacterium SH449]